MSELSNFSFLDNPDIYNQNVLGYNEIVNSLSSQFQDKILLFSIITILYCFWNIFMSRDNPIFKIDSSKYLFVSGLLDYLVTILAFYFLITIIIY